MFPKGKCFGSAAVSEKGQIVIPAEARKALGIKPGDRLLVFGREEKGFLVLVEADRVSKWVGQALADLTELSSTLHLPKSSHTKP